MCERERQREREKKRERERKRERKQVALCHAFRAVADTPCFCVSAETYVFVCLFVCLSERG